MTAAPLTFRVRLTARLVAAVAGLLLLSSAPAASGETARPAPVGPAPTVTSEPAGPAPAGPAPVGPARQSGAVDESTVADPTATVPGSAPPAQIDDTPAPTRRPTTRATEAVADAPPAPSNAIRRTSGFGNAALQSKEAKAREARKDCVAGRPPISAMLGLGGSVTINDSRPWGWIAIVVAVAASLLAFIASRLRRHRGRESDALPPRGTLETVATLVGVAGGLVGLVLTFFPTLAGERPVPEAAIAVREVHARITRGEYAAKTGASVRLSDTDKREVGNVVWLQIDLRGYGGLRPQLQYGLYDPDLGGALLPGTAKQVALLNEGDGQRAFVPIWVGYPKSQRFEAHFRLLEQGRVREMASTGKMRASRYRYACARSS